jgi:hypothetical protein
MTALVTVTLLFVGVGLFLCGYAYGRERALSRNPGQDSYPEQDRAVGVRLYANGTVAVLDPDGKELHRYRSWGGEVS